MSTKAGDAPITRLLQDWQKGGDDAQEALFSVVYQELHRVASHRLRQERDGHTLQPAGLVNEAWMRLAAGQDRDWESRAHFFGVAARLMRQVLIDHARARNAVRRQAGLRVDLTGALEVADDGKGPEAVMQLLELDGALRRLAEIDERRARVVELRYFGGLERNEIAELLGVTERMVKRDLMVAQAWLRRELSTERADDLDDP